VPRDGLSELDARCPIGFTLPPAVFDRLLAHPPVTAPWRSRLPFTIDATTRARAQDQALVEARTFRVVEDTAPLPVIRGEIPREYPELFPDTLAHEFTDADRDALERKLGPEDDGTLELELGRGV
jgi:hypothetical protein